MNIMGAITVPVAYFAHRLPRAVCAVRLAVWFSKRISHVLSVSLRIVPPHRVRAARTPQLMSKMRLPRPTTWVVVNNKAVDSEKMATIPITVRKVNRLIASSTGMAMVRTL